VIRVLLVDDSRLVRTVVRELLEEDPEIQVVGEAENGLDGVTQCLELKPDVVLMDVQMPVMGGLEAVERIMGERPTPVIVLSATISAGEVGSAFKAVRAGAFDVLPKPENLASREGYAQVADALRSRVKLYARAGRRRDWGAPASVAPAPLPRRARGSSQRVVAVGASAGGPRTLLAMLSALPPSFPCPILLVQHISPGFVRGFSQWLSKEIALPVKIVEDRELLRAGTIYLPADDRHLRVRRGLTVLGDGPPEHGCRPAVDVLFRALAEEYGSLAVAVVLTGMGKDGAQGALAVRRAGGEVLVQDEETSAIFGMPKAAIELGAATRVLPVSDIPRQLVTIVGGRPDVGKSA